MQFVPLCMFLLRISWNVSVAWRTNNYISLKVQPRNPSHNESIHYATTVCLSKNENIHRLSMNLFIGAAGIYLTFDWSAFFVPSARLFHVECAWHESLRHKLHIRMKCVYIISSSSLSADTKAKTLPSQFYKKKLFCAAWIALKRSFVFALCWSRGRGAWIWIWIAWLLCFFMHSRMSSFESHFQSEDFMPDASVKFYTSALLSHLSTRKRVECMEFSPFVSKIIKTIIYAFISGIIKQTGGVNNCGRAHECNFATKNVSFESRMRRQRGKNGGLPVDGGAFVFAVPQNEFDIIVDFLCADVTRQIHCFAYQRLDREQGNCKWNTKRKLITAQEGKCLERDPSRLMTSTFEHVLRRSESFFLRERTRHSEAPRYVTSRQTRLGCVFFCRRHDNIFVPLLLPYLILFLAPLPIFISLSKKEHLF